MLVKQFEVCGPTVELFSPKLLFTDQKRKLWSFLHAVFTSIALGHWNCLSGYVDILNNSNGEFDYWDQEFDSNQNIAMS